MHCEYRDIRDRLGAPQWYDECAVPRYCAFHPGQCANIYANEAVLLLLTCQCCGQEYHVAVTDEAMTEKEGGGEPPLHEQIADRSLDFGDPPNACCDAGATMTGEPRRVLEYWARAYEGNEPVWRRYPEFEIDCTPDWVAG